jgi:hypothetical protein
LFKFAATGFVRVRLYNSDTAGDLHMAPSLRAAESSRRLCYRTLADLITLLKEAQAAGRLQAGLKVRTHPAYSWSMKLGISRSAAR